MCDNMFGEVLCTKSRTNKQTHKHTQTRTHPIQRHIRTQCIESE